MIHETTYTKEWIVKNSTNYKRGKKKADPTLIEKVTKAFHLLEELAKTDLEFIFKGGTSLLCLLYTSPSPRDRTRSRMPSSA